MKWSDRIRDFVSFAVAGCAYHWWLHRQVRKQATAKNSEAAMKKLAEGKQHSNAQLLTKSMEPERLLVSSSN